MSVSLEDLQAWRELAAKDGMRDGVVAPCPCGQPVAIGYFKGEPAVLHRVPLCAKFNELEPDEYATYVRRAATKRMGGDVNV